MNTAISCGTNAQCQRANCETELNEVRHSVYIRESMKLMRPPWPPTPHLPSPLHGPHEGRLHAPEDQAPRTRLLHVHR